MKSRSPYGRAPQAGLRTRSPHGVPPSRWCARAVPGDLALGRVALRAVARVARAGALPPEHRLDREGDLDALGSVPLVEPFDELVAQRVLLVELLDAQVDSEVDAVVAELVVPDPRLEGV